MGIISKETAVCVCVMNISDIWALDKKKLNEKGRGTFFYCFFALSTHVTRYLAALATS